MTDKNAARIRQRWVYTGRYFNSSTNKLWHSYRVPHPVTSNEFITRYYDNRMPGTIKVGDAIEIDVLESNMTTCFGKTAMLVGQYADGETDILVWQALDAEASKQFSYAKYAKSSQYTDLISRALIPIFNAIDRNPTAKYAIADVIRDRIQRYQPKRKP